MIDMPGDYTAGKTGNHDTGRIYKPTYTHSYKKHKQSMKKIEPTVPQPKTAAPEDIMSLPLAVFETRILDALRKAAPNNVVIPRLCNDLGFSAQPGSDPFGGGPLKRLRNSLSNLRKRGQVDTNNRGRWWWVCDIPKEPEPEAFEYPEPQPGRISPDQETGNVLEPQITSWETWRPEIIAAYQFCRDREIAKQDLFIILRLGHAALKAARREDGAFPDVSEEVNDD